MSYDGIKTGMKGIIEGLALAPSDEIIDFSTASPNAFAHTYILFPETGNLDGTAKESLASWVYDKEIWRMKVAFNRGIHSSFINLDELNRKREEIIKAVDNPANWTSFARMLNVTEWAVETFENYFVLSIKIEITDTVTY